MTEAGPSSSGRRQSTGEFSDDEDLNIPLRDIREAEFSRLEAGPGIREAVEEDEQRKGWLPYWLQSKRRRHSSTGYAKVKEEDRAGPGARMPSAPTQKRTKKEKRWACGGRLGWTILYVSFYPILREQKAN